MQQCFDPVIRTAEIHNLYHLLKHANLFGGGYSSADQFETTGSAILNINQIFLTQGLNLLNQGVAFRSW